LYQKKMNNLVYVMYNLKLKDRQIRKTVDFLFDDIEFDDEWITEEGDNLDVEQTQVEGGGENDDLAGPSMNDPTILDGHAPDLDNIVFDENDNESSGEELDGDEEAGGDDFIRGLDD